MKNKKLDESKRIADIALSDSYSPPSNEERKEVEQFNQKQNKVEDEDEIIRQRYIMYLKTGTSTSTSFEEYKKDYLISKKK